MEQSDIQQQALSNARNGQSASNYAAIFHGFIEKGISESDISPRENVFTFHAWKALGRQVKKGEHGVQVCTYVPMTKKDEAGNVQSIGRKPRMTTVFHVSQTEPRNGYSENLWQYALKHGALSEFDGERGSWQDREEAHHRANEATPGPNRIFKPEDQHDYYSDEFTPV